MNVGELFISIGLKGADNAQKGLRGIGKGMTDLKNSSLEAKAAMVAMVYTLERWTIGSAQKGTELRKFADYTGLSTDKLQRWQYAARQSSVSTDEMETSIKGLQSAMAKMTDLNEGAPGKGFGLFVDKVKFDTNQANDVDYVLKKMQQFSRLKDVKVSTQNEILKNLGLTENMIQFLRTTNLDVNKLTPKQYNPYSKAEFTQLDKVTVAWSNFWDKINKTGGRLTAKNGLALIQTVSRAFDGLAVAADSIGKLIHDFPTAAKAAGVFFTAILAYLNPITALISSIIYLLSEFQKYREGKDNIYSSIANSSIGKKVGKGISKAEEFTSNLMFGGSLGNPALAAPSVGSIPLLGGGDQSITVNQNITHHGDAKDTAEVGRTHNSAARKAHDHQIKKTFSQIPKGQKN